MKLQIKDSGAWRNVATFTTRDEPLVRAAASLLLRALNQPRTVLRIAEDDMPIDMCKAPSYSWRNEAVLQPAAQATPLPTGPAGMSPAQVQDAYLAAAYDVDIEPTDEEILDIVCTTFGMSRLEAVRRIDDFNFVDVVGTQSLATGPEPAGETVHESATCQ